MSELISGKEALIALANGEEIEFSNIGYDKWYLVESYENYNIGEFLRDKLKFRLKPRTVKLEIEVPAPFEPKFGEKYYALSAGSGLEYIWDVWDGTKGDEEAVIFGAWRNEAEIKVVVEQLRKLGVLK